jgi:hypothetical protein
MRHALLMILVLLMTLSPLATRAGAPGDGASQAQAALAVAMQLFNGVPEADCESNNPAQSPCLSVLPGQDADPHGLVRISVGTSGGGGAGLAVMGRTPDGTWAYWTGGQQIVRPDTMPGAMRICTRGDGLNVRAQPSTTAPVVDWLPDGSVIQGASFVLTEPGVVTDGLSQSSGTGWFQVAAPAAGWVSSPYVFITVFPDCSVPNQFLQAEGR